jgi:hypothetical protein
MRAEGSTPEPLWLRRLPNGSLPCGLGFFHEVDAKLLVEIGPEGWTPTQQPPELSPSLSLLSRDCYFYLRKEGKCRNLTTRYKNKEILSKPKTERIVVAFGAFFSLQCPFHYKGFTIYKRPLGIVICLNYTFSVPDKRL